MFCSRKTHFFFFYWETKGFSNFSTQPYSKRKCHLAFHISRLYKEHSRLSMCACVTYSSAMAHPWTLVHSKHTDILTLSVQTHLQRRGKIHRESDTEYMFVSNIDWVIVDSAFDWKFPEALQNRTMPSAHLVPVSTSPGSGMSSPRYTCVPLHRIRPPSCKGMLVSMETALVPITGRLAPPWHWILPHLASL